MLCLKLLCFAKVGSEPLGEVQQRIGLASARAAVWEPGALAASPGRQMCSQLWSTDVASSAHTGLGVTAGGQRKLLFSK